MTFAISNIVVSLAQQGAGSLQPEFSPLFNNCWLYWKGCGSTISSPHEFGKLVTEIVFSLLVLVFESVLVDQALRI